MDALRAMLHDELACKCTHLPQESMLKGPQDFPMSALEPKVFCGWKPKDPPREEEVTSQGRGMIARGGGTCSRDHRMVNGQGTGGGES